MMLAYCRFFCLRVKARVRVRVTVRVTIQCYAPIKIIGIKIIRSIKIKKSLRLMVHISKTLKIKCPR